MLVYQKVTMEPTPNAKIELLLMQQQQAEQQRIGRYRTFELYGVVAASLLSCLIIWVRVGGLWAGLTLVSAIIPILMLRSSKPRTKLVGWITLLITLEGGIVTNPDALINPSQLQNLKQQTQESQTQ